MEMKLLIDGDSILYRVSFRGEELGEDDILVDEEVEDDGLGGMTEVDPEYAYSGDHKLHLPSSYDAVTYSIREILHSCVLDMITEDDTITEIEIHMTGKTGRLHCDGLARNFRFDYVDDYKAQRKDARPPAGLAELWAHIFSITEVDDVPCNVYVVDGAEADDTVVFLKKTHPDDYIVAALDKDVLYQSVGRHYNYGKKEFVQVTKAEALQYLYFQMIAGDPSDGYKGVPGVGKVGATNLLTPLLTEKEMYDATLALYKKKGLGLGDCLQTGIMASMHQVTDIVYKDKWIIPTLNIYRSVK